MLTKEKYLKDEIMATDTYICLSLETLNEYEIEKDLDFIVNTLKSFEKNYSRFLKNNKLWEFNHSSVISADDEMLEMIKESAKYYKETGGFFDPTVLPHMIAEGYAVSKNEGFKGRSIYKLPKKSEKHNFDNIEIDCVNKKVRKPKDLYIDLGGIGKGFIVDKIKNYLKTRYSSFCLSVGGDMYLGGKDEKNKYDYWAIEIESPFKDFTTPTLILSNTAVATSGTYKRVWSMGNATKTHIINPHLNRATTSNLISLTVIGPSTVYCDVYAKYLLLLGLEKAMEYCENYNIPAVAISSKGRVEITGSARKFVWQDE